MKKKITLLAVLGLVLALAPSARAATIYADDFSNGATQDGWVEMIVGASAFTYDGVATIVPGAANPSSLWQNFADTALQPGDTLTLSFDVMMSKTGGQTSNIRFGLGYSSSPLVDGSNMSIPVDGYMSSAPFLGNDSDPLNYWLDGDPAGMQWGNQVTVGYAVGALDNNDLYTINNSALRTIQYKISRNGSVLTGETYVNGAWSDPVTYTDIIADFKFNAVGFMASYSEGETFTYDNVTVEHTIAPVLPITLIDTDSAVTGSDDEDPGSFPNDFTLTPDGAGKNAGIYSYDYDAGASFDMLVVSVSRESGGVTFSVSYDGVSMDLATGAAGGSSASIFYLATSAQSGTIALDFTGDTTVCNGIGIGIAAIKSSDGDPIGLIDADYGTGTSITINPTVDGSFSMFAIDSNGGAFSALTSPLTQIDNVEDVGSNGFAAGYDLDVAAGEITYSYVNPNNPRGIAAANFAPVASGGTLIMVR